VLGATDPSYVVTQGDVGSRLRVRVTATNLAGSSSETSAETEPAQPAEVPATRALMSFDAAVDAYVDASLPDTSFGDSTSLLVDASPVRQAFLRFDVSGLDGRKVTGARLRMNQRGNSPIGGAVRLVSSTSWSGSVTWNTRPALDGALLGSFGTVSAGGHYEVDLGALPIDDGPLALGIDSASTTAAQWASYEASASAPPRLILEVESPAGTVTDGLSQMMGSLRGSSDPTYYPANHRMAITGAGRLLAIHGRHASGVQLGWRDPAGNWQSQTKGEAPDGGIITGSGTGDWPASIAIARDSSGSERAWIVAGAASVAASGGVYLRRLSDLDSPDGPTVGPLVLVDAPPGGAFKPDVQFEHAADGTTRGLIVWGRAGSIGYETVVGSFSDLDSDTPAIEDKLVLESGASANRWGTLVPDRGMSVVLRSNSRLVAYHHAADAPPGAWTHGAPGLAVTVPGGAAALATGELLAAVESGTTEPTVAVQRFSASGHAQDPAELQLGGYSAPSIASDGAEAWLVMVRRSDGYVVSRHYTPASGWSSADRVEIGAEGGGNYGFPNVLRHTDGRLRLMVRGPAGATSRTAVLAFQRLL